LVRRAVFLHRRRFDCGVLLVQNFRRGNKEAARAVGGRLLSRATQDGGSPDIYEHFRIRSSTHSTALHVAFGAAVVAFGLAAAATVHSLQTGTGNLRPLRIALLVWPLITGLPAYVVAFVSTAVLARVPRPSAGHTGPIASGCCNCCSDLPCNALSWIGGVAVREWHVGFA
jgi:hypothetical protein